VEQPFPASKIVGNLYYVGTYDLGCYLIDHRSGPHPDQFGRGGSYPLIKANIEALAQASPTSRSSPRRTGTGITWAILAGFQKISGKPKKGSI